MPTLVLSRSEVQRLLDPAAVELALRSAFAAYSTERTQRALRIRSDLPGPGTATVLFPGTVAGIPAYSVKVHAKFPGEDPAIRGVLCLHDLKSGALLAIMDSTHLTAVRTGVAGALAAHTLARPDAHTVAIIGAGVQGEQQLRSLERLRRLSSVTVFDTAPGRAGAFVERLGPELGLSMMVATSLEQAVSGADIVLTATWARSPFLTLAMIRPGTHITTLGPDEPGKCEVASDVLRHAVFICDDRELAVTMGAVGGAGLTGDVIAAELGEVLAGRHPGRKTPDEITVYGGVGLAFQDVVAGWCIYQAARKRQLGRSVDFLA